jgi:hypothetical protein
MPSAADFRGQPVVIGAIALNRRERPIFTLAGLSSYISSCFILLAVAGLPSILSAQSQVQAEVKIGLIGDQTYSSDPAASYRVLAEAARIVKEQKVDAVIHTGDLVESTGEEEKVRAEFAQATGILNEIGKPWHLAPGDHDVDPPKFEPDSQDDSRKRLYYDLYHAHEPKLSSGLWHSFDVGEYHFVALNSQERFHVDPRWGDVFLSGISKEQLSWLKQDLAAHRRAKGIVVFLHQPLWYNWAWWAPVHAVLRDYPVRAVIAGHFHYDQDEGEIDHIHYLVMGATGADTKHADRTSGGIGEVAVLTLRNGAAEARLIPLDGGGPLEFTPRIDMDRVQALHVILWELYRFGDNNQLCAEGGRIYGTGKTTPQLALAPVGNPIDLPVRLSVAIASEGKFSLQGARFISDSCRSVSADGDCTLAPGARVQISNNSLVTLSGDEKHPLAPLWQAGLSLKPGLTAQPGDVVTLTVRLAFGDGRQTHWVESSATSNLSACASPGPGL